MKKITNLILLLLIVCLVGCGGNEEEQSYPENDDSTVLEDETNVGDRENSAVDTSLKEKEMIPVNNTKESVSVALVPMQSRIAATSENKIYFCNWEKDGEEAAVYSMEIGQDKLTKMDIEIPENMRVCDMTTDKYNQLYLLLSTPTSEENVRSIIRKFDADGKFIEEMDITEALGENVSLHYGFLISDKGDYYLKGVGVSAAVNKDGEFLWKVVERDNGINCYASAVSKDGEIYIAYQKAEGQYLGKVNMEDGSIAEEYALADIDGGNVILSMKAGTDSDFLLYEDGGGVWAYDLEGVLENRENMSEGTLSANETISFRTFLDDGRLLLVKSVAEGDVLKERIFQYIPAGR